MATDFKKKLKEMAEQAAKATKKKYPEVKSKSYVYGYGDSKTQGQYEPKKFEPAFSAIRLRGVSGRDFYKPLDRLRRQAETIYVPATKDKGKAGELGFFKESSSGKTSPYYTNTKTQITPPPTPGGNLSVSQPAKAKTTAPQWVQDSKSTGVYTEGDKTFYAHIKDDDNIELVNEETYNGLKLKDAGKDPRNYSDSDRALDTIKATSKQWLNSQASQLHKYGSTTKAPTGDLIMDKDGKVIRVNPTTGGVGVFGQVEDEKGFEAFKKNLQKQKEKQDEETLNTLMERNRKYTKELETAKIGTSKAGTLGLDVLGASTGLALDIGVGRMAPYGTLASMYGRSAGGSYMDALDEGATEGEAFLYSELAGLAEAGTEKIWSVGKLLPGMTGVKGIFNPDKVLKTEVPKLLKSTAGRDAVTMVKKIGLASTTEGAEEVIAGLMEPLIRKGTYARDEDIDWEQASKDALYQGLIGALMGGGFGAVDVGTSVKQGMDMRQSFSNEEIINKGLSTPEDSKTFMLARQLKNVVDSGGDLGNLDVSTLQRAIQEEKLNQQKAYEKKQATADAVIARETDGAIYEPVQADYAFHEENRTDTYESAKYGEVYKQSVEGLVKRTLPEEIVAERDEAALKKATNDAASIARISVGQASVFDFDVLMNSNPAARETFEEVNNIKLPESNKETAEFLNNLNADNRIYSATEGEREFFLMSARTELGSYGSIGFGGIVDNYTTAELPDVLWEYKNAWTEGNLGNANLDVESGEYSYLSRSDAMNAFRMGKNDRQLSIKQGEEVKAVKDKKKKKTPQKKKVGTFREESITDKTTSNYTEYEKIKPVLEAVSREYGVDIVVQNEIKDKKGNQANGYYSNGTIYLSLNAVNKSLLDVFKHEFTHHLEKTAPDAYRALSDFVFKKFYESDKDKYNKAVKDKMEQYQAAGIDMKTMEDAKQELLADAAMEFLRNEETVKEFFAENQKMAEKVLSVLKDIIEKFKALIKGKAYNSENQWLHDLGVLEEAEAMWIRAAKESKGVEVADGESEFSINNSYEADVDSWYKTNTAEERTRSGGFFEIGTTSDVLKKIGVKDSRFILGKSKVQKILNDHAGMNIDMIKQIPSVLEYPMIVMQSNTVANSIVVFGELTDMHDNPLLVAVKLEREKRRNNLSLAVVTSAYGKAGMQSFLNTSDILYINPDKEKTHSWLSALGVQFPSAITDYGYIGTVTYYDPEIKSKPEKTAMQAAFEKAASKKRRDDTKFSLVQKGMSDQERYDVLKNMSVSATVIDSAKIDYDMEQLSGMRAAEAKKKVLKLAEELGIVDKKINQEDIELELSISGHDIDKWAQSQPRQGYGGTYTDFVKMLYNIDPIISKAKVIEAHNDMYKGTIREENGLESVYVLLGAMVEDNAVKPVHIDIKQYQSLNKVYLAVTLNKIAEVEGMLENNSSAPLFPAVDVSLAQIFKNIKPDQSVLKYVPDQFLSEEQLSGKAELLEKTERKKELLEQGIRPTETDVNYSLPTVQDMEVQALKDKIEAKTSEMRLTHGKVPDPKQIKEQAKELHEMWYLNDADITVADIESDLTEIYALMNTGNQMDNLEEIYKKLTDLSGAVTESGYYTLETEPWDAQEKRDLAAWVRTANVFVPYDIRRDIAPDGWGEFRKKYFGKINLVKSQSSISPLTGASVKTNANDIDVFLTELSERFGDIFQYQSETVHPADAFLQLIEILDSIDKVHKYKLTMEERESASISLAESLFDSLNTIQPKVTFADRKKAEKIGAVKKEKQKAKTAMEKTRELALKREEKQRKKAQERFTEQKKRLREQQSARVEKLRENHRIRLEIEKAKGAERVRLINEQNRQKQKDLNERGKARVERKRLMARIEKNSNILSEMLLKPTDKRHIPEGYRRAVAEMLAGLNFENTRTDAWKEKHGKSKRILRFDMLAAEYAKVNSKDTGEIEPDEMMQDMLQNLSDKVDGRRLADLTDMEIEEVDMVLRAMKHQVSNINYTFNENIKENVSDLGESVIMEFTGKAGQKFTGGAMGFIRDVSAVFNAKPIDFFDRIGGTLERVFTEIVKAEDNHIRNLQNTMEYIEELKEGYGKKELQKWSSGKGEKVSFTLGSGKTIELIPSQVMSLYALNKREQARGHILGSGIVIAPVGFKNSPVAKLAVGNKINKEKVELSYKDVQDIVGSLSEKQIAVADAFIKYMNDVCSAWGNETSMKMYGYEKFREPNYFPIKSDKMYLEETSDKKATPKLKNAGFTKSTIEQANNPIVIMDFFDVVTNHINTMSMYNTFVPAVTDFERVYNYNSRGDKGINTSVKYVIDQKLGQAGLKYINKLLEDINTQYQRDSDFGVADTLLRNWKATKIGANARVLIQQPTALTRAQVYIDYKYLAAGMTKRFTEPKYRQRMWEIAPIAQWKHWGFSQTDISRSMSDIIMGNDSLYNKAVFGVYGWADDIAWAQIFAAVEKETQAEHPELEYDSPEYRDHVNERFRYIVDRTQVVDSVLHRSHYMRNQERFMRSLTSFMAEPTTQMNMWVTALTKSARELKAGNKKEAARIFTRFGQNYIVSMLTLSLAASLISAMRESWTGDDDDDEYKDLPFVERWLKQYFKSDLLNNINPLNQFPWTRDVMSLIDGYTVERVDMSMISDAVVAAKNWKNYFNKDGDVKYSPFKLGRDAAEAVVALFGIPLKNVNRDLEMLTKTFFRATGNKEFADYLFDKLELNENYSKNTSTFIDHYIKAMKNGDSELAGEVWLDLEENGVDVERIERRIWSTVGEDYKEELLAGEDVTETESTLLKVGVDPEDLEKKKEGYISRAFNEAVGELDQSNINSKGELLKKYFGYTNEEVNNKVVDSIREDYFESLDNNDTDRQVEIKRLLNNYGYTDRHITIMEGSHYKDDYRRRAYLELEAGNESAAYAIAQSYVDKYPEKMEGGEIKPTYKNGASGMIYGFTQTSPEKIAEWKSKK